MGYINIARKNISLYFDVFWYNCVKKCERVFYQKRLS